MDAQDSIDNPLKYWCEYSGDLPKEDDDSVYDTKEPIYIKDITKYDNTNYTNDWINYISREGVNGLLPKKKSGTTTEAKTKHVLEMRNFGKEKQEKIDESRKLRPLQPSKDSTYFDILEIETEGLEFFINQGYFTDNRPTAKKYKLNQVKVDILKPLTKKPCPFVLFLHQSGEDKESIYTNYKKNINQLLKSKIACVIINYNTDKLINSYYQVKYTIQHLKFFSRAYNIDYNKMGLIGQSLGAQMAYLFGHYSSKRLKKLESLMEIENTPFSMDTYIRLLVLIDSQLYMDCRKYPQDLYYENDNYINEEMNIDMVTECTDKLTSWYGVDYTELDADCNRKLLEQTHLLNFFNDNKSNVPMFILNDNKLDNKYKLSNYNNKDIILKSPVFSKILYDKSKENSILVEGHIPALNISSCMNFSEFISKYL
jgi:hypothetical protein